MSVLRLLNKQAQSSKNGTRIDVENPGNRQGQIHLQKDGVKYYYNIQEQTFRVGSSSGKLASKSIQKVLNDPAVIKAVAKGLRILDIKSSNKCFAIFVPTSIIFCLLSSST